MAITYTTFLTENPNSNTQRIYRGYAIAGVGVVFNVIVKINPSQGDFRSVDSEVFIPGATLSDFSGMSWSAADTTSLGAGQKRYVRTFTVGGLGQLVELIRSVKYANIEQIGSIDVIFANKPGTAPWFEWNATDLSQFGTKVTGPKVASSTISVLSWRGVNWIDITTTSNATGASGDFCRTACMLPIAVSPPTPNNIIVADFVNIQLAGASEWIGAIVSPRFTNLTDGYVAWFDYGNDVSLAPHRFGRLAAGPTVVTLATNQADPTRLVQGVNGMRLGLGIEGSTVLTGLAGERQIISDSGVSTSTGGCAIGTSSNGLPSTTIQNRFRNIRCYTIIGNKGVEGI